MRNEGTEFLDGSIIRNHTRAERCAFLVVDALQRFRPQARHINTRRTLFAAGFAGKAIQQYLLYLCTLYIVTLSLQPLAEQIGSRTGGL